MPSGLLFFKFNYIFNFAMKYSTKVVYLCGAYSVAFAHTVNRTAAYIIFIYKRIRWFAFLFNRFPERRINNFNGSAPVKSVGGFYEKTGTQELAPQH